MYVHNSVLSFVWFCDILALGSHVRVDIYVRKSLDCVHFFCKMKSFSILGLGYRVGRVGPLGPRLVGVLGLGWVGFCWELGGSVLGSLVASVLVSVEYYRAEGCLWGHVWVVRWFWGGLRLG